MSELAGLKRIAARHKLKDRIKFYEDLIKTHQPIMAAMRVTQQAFQQGIMEGIKQVAAAEREREAKAAEASSQTPAGTAETVEAPAPVESPKV